MDNNMTRNTNNDLQTKLISINVDSNLQVKKFSNSTLIQRLSSSLPEESMVSTKVMKGDLTIPVKSKAIVLFAHGSGSGRNSPRNRLVARVFNQVGIATLLMDLLTEDEEKVDLQTKEYRFNIPLLINRLTTTIDYVNCDKDIKYLPIGIFGASTGAAAALAATYNRSTIVKTAACRGGRVDLAYKYCNINQITLPILLLVGENDPITLRINERLYDDLKSVKPDRKKISVIPGATHLFEEQGKLEQVSRIAGSWFKKFLIET